MGVTVKIGSEQRDLSEVTDSWIAQQIVGRRRDGMNVCVAVAIQTADLSMRLTTPACPASAGSRAPYPREQRIFDLWNERRLNFPDFAPGDVVAFLKQLGSLL
jgi:hypothetical protein